ncbi:MAG: NAD(P)H-hydrate epimerase [Gemmatimonadetes bacterium]|nr:NAD(P)H-hydrate epimerase [Gemmatimonadota bacterium]
MTMPVVTSAQQAARADASAIAAGIPSRALMQRAGVAAATEIAARFPDDAERGVVVVTGPGNNGGDGWVIARALHAVGIPVRVVEAVAAKSPDAVAERALAVGDGVPFDTDLDALFSAPENLFVDAILGTGLTSDEPLRGNVMKAVGTLIARQRRGATIVAIDTPTGVDATYGVSVATLKCALTITFCTMKQGLTSTRDLCGDIVLVDIGLGSHAERASKSRLATASWFRETLPAIAADSHKGTRRKVAIIGGASGMAGAVILAARAALKSGAGMVKCAVAPESLLALQEAEPAALSAAWPTDDASFDDHIAKWADAILLGPGLGREHAREIVERALRIFKGPVVLDADALNAFAGDVDALGALIARREALLTPHPAEFARLVERDVDDVLYERFEAPLALAHQLGATILFKGVPTIIASPTGEMIVVAEGTPILATGGAGDVLGGIAVTLLAQTDSAQTAGALAAFAHGRAASAVSARQVRGYTLDDVLAALPSVWSLVAPRPRVPVLAELPAVGETT